MDDVPLKLPRGKMPVPLKVFIRPVQGLISSAQCSYNFTSHTCALGVTVVLGPCGRIFMCVIQSFLGDRAVDTHHFTALKWRDHPPGWYMMPWQAAFASHQALPFAIQSSSSPSQKLSFIKESELSAHHCVVKAPFQLPAEDPRSLLAILAASLHTRSPSLRRFNGQLSIPRLLSASFSASELR